MFKNANGSSQLTPPHFNQSDDRRRVFLKRAHKPSERVAVRKWIFSADRELREAGGGAHCPFRSASIALSSSLRIRRDRRTKPSRRGEREG